MIEEKITKAMLEAERERAFSEGYEEGKKNERELQCGKGHIESLKQRIHSLEAENESLRKSALVWHELEHLDEPDENGYIVHGNPAEEGKDYLLKFDFGYDVDTLDEDGDGFFFPAHDWSEIEAWAELPEVTECL